MVFTAYLLIRAQRLCDNNANRNPLFIVSMINLTAFEGAQYLTPWVSHCKTSAGFQQNLKILKILNMEESDTLRWPSEQPERLVKCDLDHSSAKVRVYSKPKASPPAQEATQAALLTEARGITSQRDQPYSLQWVESHSPSPLQTSRGRRGWKNEAKTGSPRRWGHCCSGLISQACDLPPLDTAQSSWSNKHWQTF